MSCYEWERGTLKIPSVAWKPLRDGLAKAFNALQAKRYVLAVEVHAALKAEKSTAKRGSFTPGAAIRKLLETNRALASKLEKVELDDCYVLERILVAKETGALLLPKKKDFPLAVATKTLSYTADEGSITLRPESREVNWSVGENNRAIDRARESVMGNAFFTLLGAVKWTRGTGGEIVGNDEYNREDESAGGGANRVNEMFGPKTSATSHRFQGDVCQRDPRTGVRRW